MEKELPNGVTHLAKPSDWLTVDDAKATYRVTNEELIDLIKTKKLRVASVPLTHPYNGQTEGYIYERSLKKNLKARLVLRKQSAKSALIIAETAVGGSVGAIITNKAMASDQEATPYQDVASPTVPQELNHRTTFVGDISKSVFSLQTTTSKHGHEVEFTVGPNFGLITIGVDYDKGPFKLRSDWTDRFLWQLTDNWVASQFSLGTASWPSKGNEELLNNIISARYFLDQEHEQVTWFDPSPRKYDSFSFTR